MYCADALSLSIYSTLKFALFSGEVPVLVYYSHLTAIIVSLLLSFFLIYHNRGSIAAKVIATISIMFSLWSIGDILLWTQIDSRVLMFIWSYWFIFFTSIFALSLYFLYTFIKGKDASAAWKVVFGLLLTPILLASATTFTLEGFDVPNCSAVENPFIINASYILAGMIFAWCVVFGAREYLRAKEESKKKQILLSTVGISLFLLCFSVATYIASIANLFDAEPDTFAIEQYGYFGMTIFIAFLTYIIVRYKAFNIKLIAAQALVVGLVILIGSQFFFIRNPINRVLNGVTLALSLGFGYLLVKSVKREVEARELIQTQKEQLEKANARLKELDIQKTEFVSFATHQLRSPLAAMRGNASLILEGDYGKVEGGVKEGVQTILTSVKTLANVVEDYLNISRIELGTMKYDLREIDFKDMVKEVVNEQKPNIDAKGLKFVVSIDDGQTYKIKADPDKFKQVVMNTIDNSVKYTKEGSLAVSLEKDAKKGTVRLKIADTGVGIRPDVMPKLFQKFSRAPSANEANIHGTGLGLFIAKQIMEAHGGRIWAESEGEGKGSQFYIELPEVK
ncbi:MAG: hypothetical protein HZA81_00300 [Candidatus Taylorbacteria bacterium]|nr:hypothetical protein [Candidatus Taylorbacteria bacterium]